VVMRACCCACRGGVGHHRFGHAWPTVSDGRPSPRLRLLPAAVDPNSSSVPWGPPARIPRRAHLSAGWRPSSAYTGRVCSLLRVVSARLILFIVSAGFLGRRSGCSVPGLRRRAASYFWLERHRSYLFIRRPSRGDACVEWIQILGHRYCRLHRY
jgi:hypothetical protein